MEQLPKMTTEALTKRVSDGKYMLFFSAGWCPDCAFIKPSMPDIEKEFSDYTFLAVDRDENIDLCVDLNVLGIPSFIAYDHGQEIGRFVNKDRKTKEQVEAFVTAL